MSKLISTTNRPQRSTVSKVRFPVNPGNEVPPRRISEPGAEPRLTYDQRRQLFKLARQREAELPIVEVEEVMFSIYSTDEIKKMAVTEVTTSKDSEPGSVNDPQMGPTDCNSLCATCSRDSVECPGHFGYIQLPEPICHPPSMREIIAVLDCVCNDCGQLLLTEQEIAKKGILRLTGAARLTALEKASLELECRREGKEGDQPCRRNPTYMPGKTKDTDQVTYKYTINGEEIENIKQPKEILDIFNLISDTDAALMGYSNNAHPKRLIMEVMMVIPPTARPITYEDGKARMGEITEMYIDIMAKVNILKNYLQGDQSKEMPKKKGQKKTKKEPTLQDMRKDVFDRIKHFINNTDKTYTHPHINGQPFVSITELIQGKEGLIRKNVMAKRVDYSARTVISPDPTLEFDQISVPIYMAPIMTPKITVYQYNRAELQALLEKGRITYITFNPKPKKEETGTQLAGTRNQVTEKYRSSYLLRDGDIVERWLQDGDYAIFNRAPTLHKYSFMAFRVVLRDQKSFGLSLSYTTPLNAD